MKKNMKKRESYKKIVLKKRFLAAALIGMVAFSGTFQVSASTLNDAKNKKNEAQSGLDSVNNQINSIKNQQQSLQTEMNSLDAELSDLLVNIAILEDELTAKKDELEQVNADLVVAQDNEAKEYADMKLRIQYMYENSDDSLTNAMLQSDGIADFLNRVDYIESVYSYDRDLLTQYQNTVQEVTDLQLQVQSEEAELEEIQTEYAAQQDTLEATIATKQSQMSDFGSKLASAQTLAKQYADTISQQNAIIKSEQAKQAAAAAAAAATAKTQNGTGTAAGTGTTAAGATGGTTADTGSSSAGTAAGGSTGGQNPSYSSGVSGGSVVSFALQFVGNPYVSGGTSLTNGCDCSGFTQSVYANFGISIPRSSSAQASCGSEVSYDNIQPGDLIYYTGHVAIYIGGGQIVNASSSAPYPIGGIKTNSATYRSIITIRRVL